MPTTIDSAGITFNDATSLTSGSIGTAQLANNSVIASKLGTTEQKQIAKAWVNFDGTTSPGTIRSSYNVSSITKNGTGNYTVNFTTAMSDANYSGVVSNGNGLQLGNYGQNSPFAAPSVSSFRIATITSVSVLSDAAYINAQFFGN